MHYVKSKGILSSKNGMNLYRGCSHGCIYCDSRSKIYNMDHAFEDIEVKENGVELLKNSLKRKQKKCMIGTGSMTDPYIPLESKIQNIRQSLELIKKYNFGFTAITKSNLVLRDLDLLKEINEKTKVVIQMTLTSYDEELCKIIEPNVCTTKERVKVLKKLNEAKIPTVVWFCPFLPFINDNEENLKGLLDYCIEANVKGIICFGIGMTLREGNREYFYKKLEGIKPGLKEKYIKTYGNSYGLNSPNNKELMKLFHNTCEKHNIMHNNQEIFNYLHKFEEKEKTKQSTLF